MSIGVEKQTQMMFVHQSMLSTVLLKMTNFPLEMSDCIWQHQKYARPETYRSYRSNGKPFLFEIEPDVPKIALKA